MEKPTRIVGGLGAIPGEVPWQVSLKEGSRHFCGILNREFRRGLLEKEDKGGRRADSTDKHARQLKQHVQRPWGRQSRLRCLG